MMITPMKPSTTAKQRFITCDLENDTRDGRILSIDTCWRGESGELMHHECEQWSQFWEMVVKRAIEDSDWRTIWAHNGCGYDWLSLGEWLMENMPREHIMVRPIRVNNTMLALIVEFGDWHEKDSGKVWKSTMTIKFVDSIKMLKSGLDKLSDKLLGRRKVDLGDRLPHEVYETDRELFNKYKRLDTENLLLCLERCLDIIRENLALVPRLSMTISSTAMKVFRTGFLNEAVMIPWDKRVKAFLREGYHGGRVEVFKYGEYSNVRVFDVNSLYPAMMKLTPVPTSASGCWTKEYQPDKAGCYRIKFNQSAVDKPAFFLVNGKGTYNGEGTYYAPELAAFKRHHLGSFTVIEGYIFRDSGLLFAKFVDRVWQLRQSDSGGPIDTICKFIGNGLYGKTGEKGDGEYLMMFQCFHDYQQWKIANPKAEDQQLNPKKLVYAVKESYECLNEHVGIAGTITSAARVALYEGMLSVWPDLIYVDTDSIHTTKKTMFNVGGGLGQFKLETSAVRAIYCGRKLYALDVGYFDVKIRAKGVSVGGRNGEPLHYDHFARMAKRNDAISCTFNTPPTMVEVFSGRRRSLLFDKRKRTIKVTR